jgi:hypothetical protein
VLPGVPDRRLTISHRGLTAAFYVRTDPERRVEMKKLLLIAVAVVVLVASAAGGTALGSAPAAKRIKLADSTLIVEVNATDGDAGLQVFLDGEPWRSMRITAPNGREIVDVETKSRLRGYGLTELFSESSEPPFNEFPLERFKELFPEGRYTFAGETIAGRALTGAARLSHDIPDGPKIVAPRAGAVVGRDGLVGRWGAVAERGGVEIVGYRAIVTRENPLRVLEVDLPGMARKVTVPAEFLERGVEYKLEVQAIEEGGNQTLTEITFRVK